jgi:hypothetical protein
MHKRMSVFARFTLPVVLVASTLLLGQNQQPHASPPEQAQPPAQDKLDLSDQVIRDVFTPMQQGMEGHNLMQVLATFDDDKMPDYAHVRDQLRAVFDQYDSIRFRYQLLQVTSDKTGASAVAEIDMEATPVDESQVGLQRGTQMRFRLVRGSKGWKLAGFSPADFFD